MRKLPILLLLLVVLLSSSWVLLQSAVRLMNYSDIRAAWSGDERFVLDRPRFPGGPLFRALKDKLAPGELTLVFRQSDFTLYGTGRWLSDWDTAVKPLYRLADAAEAFQWLRQRHVRFALLPNYLTPTYYRTAVGQVLTDLRYAEPVGEHRGYRLLRLRDAPVEDTCRPVDMSRLELRFDDSEPSFVAAVTGLPSLTRYGITAGGNSATMIGVTEVGVRPVDAAALSIRWTAGSGFRVSTGRGPIDFAPSEKGLQLAPGVSAVRAAFELSGRGLVGINVLQYLSNGERVSSQHWSGVVDQHKRLAAVLFKPKPEATSFRIVLTNLGRSPGYVSGSALSICRSGNSDVAAVPLARARSQTLKAWDVKRIASKCKEGRLPIEGPVGAVERSTDSIRVLSNRCVLNTEGAVLDRRFAISVVTEPWRIRFENHPESRLGGLALPFLYWLAGPEPDSASIGIEAKVRARGDGGMALYVQWKRHDGGMQTKLIGGASLAAAFQDFAFQATVPEDASDLELVAALEGTGVEVTSMAVGRLLSPSVQSIR